jgi:Arc/MetJ-type ribon-helix-helix transcriptional regulator
MTQTDIDTLDKLVRDKTFPSRSAFVRAALSAANS